MLATVLVVRSGDRANIYLVCFNCRNLLVALDEIANLYTRISKCQMFKPRLKHHTF